MGVQRTYLKELRIKAGLTQQEVADKIGVTKATISKYEKGQRGIKHVNELARLYGVEPMYILTGETTQEWRDKLDREMEMEREYWEKEFKSRLAHQQEITRKPLKIKGFRVFLLLWVWLFSLMFSLMRLKTGKNGAVRRPKDTETGTAG